MNEILSYFDFTGEDIEGNYFEGSFDKPMTESRAQFEITEMLCEVNGGHIDVWYAETGEFAFDVEV